MTAPLHRLLLLLSVCLLSLHGQEAGDDWNTTRGDATPGLRYQVSATTGSGRIIGLNSGGGLMISDNQGSDWRFDEIEENGVPVRGTFTDLYQVPDGPLIAVMVRLQEATEGVFKYQARSYFVTSTDNGNTWRTSPFPKTSARYRFSGREFHGVNLSGLHQGPGGELLAYGTISGTNTPGILWSIGGVIFRQAGATWEQAIYDYGPIGKVTDANGRAVAAAYNGVLDSGDGAGWNGYTFGQAQVNVDGVPMDPNDRERLRILDIEVVDGTYIGIGGTFVPWGSNTRIDTNIFEKVFKLSSPTPFSGARNWTAFQQNFYPGSFTRTGAGIVATGAGGAYFTNSGGEGFTLASGEVFAAGGAVASAGGNTAYAVESSETVWKSASGGTSWEKVWDKDVGPDLRMLGYFDGQLYARANNRELWLSSDGGQAWTQQELDVNIGAGLVRDAGGRLITTAGTSVHVSDDDGVTWTTNAFPDNPFKGGFLIQESQTGRLIIPAEGADARNEGKFFISDDRGDTWQPTIAGHMFGEDVRTITQTKSGRLLVGTNTFASFEPSLFISDDDGDTWRRTTPLANLEGLDTVTGDPSTKVFEWFKMFTSTTGRVLAMSDRAVLYSDDDGDTWQLSENFDRDGLGQLDFFEMTDMIQAGARWVAVGHYRFKFPQRRFQQIILVSDDDGGTWGIRPFETTQANTFLQTLAVTDNGRLIITGTNASVYVSEFDVPMSMEPETFVVIEGGDQTILIDRPDLDGAITARYATADGSAKAGTDYAATSGTLDWAADDMEAKPLTVQTVDNERQDDERIFALQMSVETSDGLLAQLDSYVGIMDNDSGVDAGLVFEKVNDLFTSELGDSVLVGVALEVQPTADVILDVTGLDETEGQLSTTQLTFTPDNWGLPQRIVVTGVDDPDPDGNATYNLTFISSSEDERYEVLSGKAVGITNRGDELLPTGGGDGFATWVAANNLPDGGDGPLDDPNNDGIVNLLAYALGKPPLGPLEETAFRVSREGIVTFTVPQDNTDVVFGSEVSSSLLAGSWAVGPVPTAGATANGQTTYTLTLPLEMREQFVRITARLE